MFMAFFGLVCVVVAIFATYHLRRHFSSEEELKKYIRCAKMCMCMRVRYGLLDEKR